jgi:predicted dehydrogenase
LQNLAIVGLGRWGRVLVDSVQGRSDRVRFTAAVGRDPAAAAEHAKPRGLKVLPDLAAALADPDVHGIVLATPHSRHGAEVAACAAAMKPVMVEKPFTLTHASAKAALDAAQGKIIVAAAHNRRFLPALDAMQALIDDGTLGTLLHLEGNFSGNVVGRYTNEMWRVAPGESPAGGLAGSGIHLIDTMIRLAGPMTRVFAQSSRRVHAVPLDDTTSVLLTHASGVTASLNMMTATRPTFRLSAYGTKGRADLTDAETLVHGPIDEPMTTRNFEKFDIERAELEAFADAIAGRAPYPIPWGDILNGVAVFEAVSRSITAGGPVTIAA